MANNEKRVLGDEWLDWDGRSGSGKLDASHYLFLALGGIGLVIFTLILFLQWYLIKPRLDQFSSFFPIFFLALITAVTCVMLSMSLILLVSIIFKKQPFGLVMGILLLRMIRMVIPVALWVGKTLGVSVDKIGNSFVKVHNSITNSIYNNRLSKDLLILVPRCIKKEMLLKLKDLEQRYELEMRTVGGGTAALKLIREKRPSSIIGIACERDLLHGIKDLSIRIPVIGIPNERPEGPCKNTMIDLEQLELAVRLFAMPKHD